MNDNDIPARPPDDAVMASLEESRSVLDWASQVFTGKLPSGREAPAKIEVRRQDFNVLRFGRSCMETPIRIGQEDFAHGLGTHANSEIVVHLPKGASQFKAFAGIDNNYDTQGTRGSVVFSVEAQGKELARSPVLRGGDKPFPVAVAIPKGAAELVLKVDTTPDGPGHDQADWADAELVLADGTRMWLDDGQLDLLLGGSLPPFSFAYNGASSSELLKSWQQSCETKDGDSFTEYTIQWTDPKTALCVTAAVRAFTRYPAVEWVLHFENKGAQDTPILQDIQALDVLLRTGNSKNTAMLRQNQGDVCNENSFRTIENAVESGKGTRMTPAGGRSSNGAFPFFDIQYGDELLTAAIGWSGQWAASIDRTPAGPTRLRAGMEQTRLVLHPGEAIRTPRILLMLNRCDAETAHNRFRRLMLFHYVPQHKGKPVRMPIASQCFDRYSWTRPEWATEAGQREAVRFAHDVGFDTHWLDAAWFVGGFPNGVGNWYPKPKEFPNGLKPVAEECHANGMKFILWVEPERVAKESLIAREHPDFVFGGAEGGLFKLNDPDARRWLTELLSKLIADSGIDVYRNDFNIDPLDFWRRNDSPDRQGMTEIRYVEGLYAMWDELLARHPGLVIDNCASGGRRIDIEMCMRSVPLWRSDTNCSSGHADWNQAHSMGICQYVPLNTACAWTPEVYEVRSTATAGLICQFAYMDDGFPIEKAKASLAEVKENQKYWYGDLYSLVSPSSDRRHWAAWQLHRADLDEGIVLVFRRGESDYTGLQARLRALAQGATYTVTFVDEARNQTVKTLSGKELADLEIRMSERTTSLLVRYKRTAG